MRLLTLQSYIAAPGSLIKDLNTSLPSCYPETQLYKYLQNNFNTGKFFTDLGSSQDLMLTHPENDFLNLPWENLIPSFVNVSQPLSVYRSHEGIFREVEGAVIDGPLRILVVLSSPADSPPDQSLNIEKEELKLLKAFGDLILQAKVEVDFCEDAVFENVLSKIQQKDYHILHISGHGNYNHAEGYFSFQGEKAEDFTESEVKDQQFVKINEGDWKIPLVFLSLCSGARGSYTDNRGKGLTNLLLQTGSQAVIGMSREIMDSICTDFVQYFYQELSLYKNYGSAFFGAKKKLRELITEDKLIAQTDVPVLYLSHFPGRLNPTCRFQEKQGFPDKSPLQFTIGERAKGYRFYGRRRLLREARLCLNSGKGVYFKGQGGTGKTCLAEKLVQNLSLSLKNPVPVLISPANAQISVLWELLEGLIKKYKKNYIVHTGMMTCPEDYVNKLFMPLLSVLNHNCDLILVIDNMESFQKDTEGTFKEEYLWLKMLFKKVLITGSASVIATGRYACKLAGESPLEILDTGSASPADFTKKISDQGLTAFIKFLNLVRNSGWYFPDHYFTPLKNVGSGNGETGVLDGMNPDSSKNRVAYVDFIHYIHRRTGGNFRALDQFLVLIKQNTDPLNALSESIDSFNENAAGIFLQILNNLSTDLIMDELWSQLTTEEKRVALLFKEYNLPVCKQAMVKQDVNISFASEAIAKLYNLTFLENLGKGMYFMTELTRDMIDRVAETIDSGFNHQEAGEYYWQYILQTGNINRFMNNLISGKDNSPEFLTQFHGEPKKLILSFYNKLHTGLFFGKEGEERLKQSYQELMDWTDKQPMEYSMEAFRHYRIAQDYEQLNMITEKICDRYSRHEGAYNKTINWIALTKKLIAPAPLSLNLLHLYGSALIYLRMNLAIARGCYEEIMVRTDPAGSPENKNIHFYALAYSNIAQILLMEDKYAEALEILKECELLFQDYNAENIYFLYALFGWAYLGLLDTAKAKKYYLKALEGHPTEEQRSTIYLHLGDIFVSDYDHQNKDPNLLQQATDNYNQALEITSNPNSRLMAMEKLAGVFLSMGKHDIARHWAEKGRAMAVMINNSAYRELIENKMKKISLAYKWETLVSNVKENIRKKEYKLALNNAEEALTLAKKTALDYYIEYTKKLILEIKGFPG